MMMKNVGIWVYDGYQYKLVYETCNMVKFRQKIDELISNGTKADNILIGNKQSIQARLMEKCGAVE